MPLSFPNNPSIGDQYSGVNNVVYEWDGEKWKSISFADTPSLISSGDTRAQVTDSGSDGEFKVFTENTEQFAISPSGDATLLSQNELRFGDADNSNYVGFKGPATVSGDIVWVLPSGDGAAGEVLGTTGSGELYWTVGGGGGASVAVSGNPPASPDVGDIWFDTDEMRSYVYYDDGDSQQWVEMNPSWNGTVPDGSIYPQKLSSGGPSWTPSGDVTISGSLAVDTNTLYVDAVNDRIGIGTNAPTYNLDVESSGDTVIRARSSTTANPSFILSEDNNTKWQFESVNNSDNRLRIINQSSSEVVTVDQSGNVGFGSASSGFGSPKVHVHGTVSTDGLVNIFNNSNSGDVNHGMLNLINTTTGAVGNDSRIMFTFRQTGSSSTLDPMASIGAVKESGSHSAGLTFNTRSAPGTYAERMRIQSNGYISTPDNSSAASGLQIGYQKLQAITGSFSANNWYDTGIDRTTDTGIFEVDLFVDTWNAGGQSYSMKYTGWFIMHPGSTNSTAVSNIDMHRTGHAPNNETIQLRTILSPAASGGNIRLQWLSNFNLTLNNAGGSLLRIALRRFAATQ